MSKMSPARIVLLLFFMAAGAGCRTAADINTGRQALMINNHEQALAYFERAVQRDPNYVFVSDAFRESVWTYLGRAQYQTGKLAEAEQSFRRALDVLPGDFLARLYFGLTLARMGDRTQGLREIEAGLKETHEWLEYMQATRAYTSFWDPLRQIRSEIEKDLDMIGGRDIDWPKLIESAEWVGRQMEIEVERVREDERRFRDRQFDRDRPGVGLGIGIGVGF